MTLRQRIVFTLALITLILIAPAVYGLFALYDLRDVARSLRERDAVGALALGRLQTAVGEVESRQRIYLAIAEGPPDSRVGPRDQVAGAVGRVEAELDQLTRGGYGEAAAPARAAWSELRAAIAEEQRLVEAGEIEAADEYRTRVVDPAFVAVNSALDPIGQAINFAGAAQVERAQDLAAASATTTLLALAVALLIVISIGGLLTRSLLRPVRELRRGMAVVSGGDFEPDLHIPLERSDEIGDLARSFQRMTEQLLALDRMKAEFVSVASHELKTPLSVIRGYVSLLLDGVYGRLPDEHRKVLGAVGDQTDRLGRLIQQLLDISRFEAGGVRLEPKPVDVRAFLEEFATSFDALAMQSQIDFRVEIDPAVPEAIVGDPDRLNEVVGNLLSNAFKFTPRGGRIRLRARAGRRDTERALVIEVEDTGVGIPADQLPRVFEKFYQVENEAQPKSLGSGLGLAISREIVEAHGGMIGAESAVGQGATFRVLLPVDPAVAPTP